MKCALSSALRFVGIWALGIGLSLLTMGAFLPSHGALWAVLIGASTGMLTIMGVTELVGR